MAAIKTILPPEQAFKQLRVAAYCRVSSGSENQQHSFSAQVQYYTELIQKHPDWTLVDIYADEGISGTSTERREEFRRLMQDCARGKIDRILTKSVSRFARNTVDCLNAVRQLSSMGVSILFEKEQIDSSKMSSEILLAMSGIQAQEESVSISNNMRWSYEKRMKSGDFISCHAPYGYKLNGSKLEIELETASVVQEIFRMYLDGVNKLQIAEYLNQHQIPCRHGAEKWHPSSIGYILANEKYTGDALLQKTYTRKTFPIRSVPNNGEMRKFFVTNSHEAIISEEDFQKVQYRLKHNHRNPRSKADHSLTHLLVCPDCGYYFRRNAQGNTPYWVCSRRTTDSSPCTPIRVDEEDVLTAVNRMFRILGQDYGDILKKMLSDIELAQATVSGTGKKIYELDCEISCLTRKLHKIASMQAIGILDPADFTAQTSAVNQKLSALRRQRCQLLQQSDDAGDLARLREVCETIMDAEPTDPALVQALRSCIEKIVVTSETELHIHLLGGLVIPEHLPEKKRRCCRI